MPLLFSWRVHIIHNSRVSGIYKVSTVLSLWGIPCYPSKHLAVNLFCSTPSLTIYLPAFHFLTFLTWTIYAHLFSQSLSLVFLCLSCHLMWSVEQVWLHTWSICCVNQEICGSFPRILPSNDSMAAKRYEGSESRRMQPCVWEKSRRGQVNFCSSNWYWYCY